MNRGARRQTFVTCQVCQGRLSRSLVSSSRHIIYYILSIISVYLCIFISYVYLPIPDLDYWAHWCCRWTVFPSSCHYCDGYAHIHSSTVGACEVTKVWIERKTCDQPSGLCVYAVYLSVCCLSVYPVLPVVPVVYVCLCVRVCVCVHKKESDTNSTE